jgi:hypothetical protein
VIGLLAAGAVVGAAYRPERPFPMSTLPAVAVSAGTLALVALVIGLAITPQTACGNTGCDTGYGLGTVLLAHLFFVALMPGAALGRAAARRQPAGGARIERARGRSPSR